jgi:hypothetical protein
MAQTRRITYDTTPTDPKTEYGEGADVISQSQAGNYSVVRVSATCINRGSTGAFSNYNGTHTAAIDGYGGSASRSGTMPSGVPNGGVRWDVSADITIAHDSAGNKSAVTLRQTVSGWYSNVKTASFGGFTRIPKRPSPPGTPVATLILPTSIDISFTASTDDAGSAITGYLVRYWPNPEGTGAYTDVSETNTLVRTIPGLTPGSQYRIVVYAKNGSADNGGYSNVSGAIVVRTLSGMWFKDAGVWKRAAVFVKNSGLWKTVAVFIKDAGVWKRGG